MKFETLLLEQRDGVDILTLNRPDALNSFSDKMADEFRAVLDGLMDGQLSGRALLITGAGRGFCAGADLIGSINPNDPAMAKDVGIVLERHYNQIIKTLQALPVPVVAAVNGPCAGAGMSLAMACDIIIAGRSAAFVQAFVNISLVPDAGSSYFLPRLVGKARAARMMMLGEKIGAEEAERWGLVSAVVDDDKLMDEAMRIAAKLAAGPTQALAMTRDLLTRSADNSLSEQLDLEREYQKRAGRLDDFKEGVDAFINKRKPSFKGQ